LTNWEDYYEILGVSPDASQEEIKKAHRDNVFIFHPDRMTGLPESARRRAEEKMKKVNEAYDILGDPEKRQQYHSEWLRQKGGTTTSQQQGDYTIPKPKPVVDPPVIRFDNVPAKTVRTDSFIIRNQGGPWSEIWISDPKSWVTITNYISLSDSEELPLRVEIKVEAEDWDRKYSEYIRVRLDEEETIVKIELQTKPKPIRRKVGVGVKPRSKPTYTPPPSPPYTPPAQVSVSKDSPIWRVLLVLEIFGLMIVLMPIWITSKPCKPSVRIRPDPNQTAPEVCFYKKGGLNPKEWKFTNTTVRHSSDGGKTWNTLLFLSLENLKKSLKRVKVPSDFWPEDGRQPIESETRWYIWRVEAGDEYLGDEFIVLIAAGYLSDAIVTCDGGKTWQIGCKTKTLQTSDGGKTWRLAKKINYKDALLKRAK